MLLLFINLLFLSYLYAEFEARRRGAHSNHGGAGTFLNQHSVERREPPASSGNDTSRRNTAALAIKLCERPSL